MYERKREREDGKHMREERLREQESERGRERESQLISSDTFIYTSIY